MVHGVQQPKGVVSTMEDPDGRPCVSDFVRNHHGERLFHVGRPDVAIEAVADERRELITA
jgi:23S rRNA pseudouridine2605 synthase/16S rRNA pseudouridine516 synthase